MPIGFYWVMQQYQLFRIIALYYRESIKPNQVILHSDTGGPMKGATMLSTLQGLGVMPSFSRPAVSNDNPYSESLFKTKKYRQYRPSYTVIQGVWACSKLQQTMYLKPFYIYFLDQIPLVILVIL